MDHEPTPHDSEINAQHPSIAEIRAEMEAKGDRLGRGMDAGIIEAVVGCVANGLTTRSSCEGHPDHGLAFPWIEIAAPEPTGLEEDESGLLRAQWQEANRAQAVRADALLDEFYAERESAVKLGRDSNDDDVFRIQPMPFPYGKISEEQATAYRQEMDAFASFAVQKAERERNEQTP